MGIVRKFREQKGFTLVELLVVIAIIGVLATLVLLQLGSARARARDTKRIADVNQIRTAVEQYFEDHGGKYPTDIYAAAPNGLEPTYITRMPYDPLDSTKKYGYGYDVNTNGDPVKYQIYTQLEQSAAALGASAHLKANGWNHAGVDASNITVAGCTAAPNTTACYYDQGINQ